MKKLLVALFAVAVAFSATASSGSKQASKKIAPPPTSAIWFYSSLEDGKPLPPTPKDAVRITTQYTPVFKLDNEERNNKDVSASKLEAEKTKAKHWLSVDVTFYTFPPPSTRRIWTQWIDDVEVEIDVFIPQTDVSSTGKVVNCAVLGGRVTLDSLKAFDVPCKDENDDADRYKKAKEHTVRMMIPPETIYRYFPLSNDKPLNEKDDYQSITTALERYCQDLPVMVTISYKGSYKGNTQFGYKICGDRVLTRLKKAAASAKDDRTVSSNVTRFSSLFEDKDEKKATFASTVAAFNVVKQQKYVDPKSFNYFPDALLPVSKTPFAWIRFDQFEPIKESSGK